MNTGREVNEEILSLALRVTQNALDDLVSACLRGPPTSADIMKARRHLVGWCINAIQKEQR